MNIRADTRLGAYEIVGSLGAGGMGQVYRARDAKLGRDVAIKVLPPLFAADPERLSRFEREAQSLAALNHPNIAQIFGVLEDPAALVMEFVDGEDLSLRIARGAVPVDEATAIARQIAAGLEAAHERGIVHRDLKPANVKLCADGQVKVLDFGLAKAVDGAAKAGPYEGDGPMNSPTFTSPAMTQMGVILGTAAYMAPEQAKGKIVDKRADVWAFGVVLFEMLTGRGLFHGETVTDSIAAVITRDPDWTLLPPSTPASVVRLLGRCLERDPRQRLRDIGEARIALEQPERDPAPAAVVKKSPTTALFAGACILAVALGAGWAYSASRTALSTALPALHYTITAPAGSGPMLVSRISPDGTRVAIATESGVWLRPLDQVEARQLFAHGSVRQVFWSPDSAFIGVATGDELLRVPAGGGAAERIADIRSLPGPFNPIGGDATWLADGRIVFVTGMSAVMEVPASGGEPKEIVRPATATEDFHGAAVLPSGGIISIAHDGKEVNTIVLLRNGARTTIHHAEAQVFGIPVYSATGHILFAVTQESETAAGTWALPFDEKHGVRTGEPFRILDSGTALSVSTDGRMLLASGAGETAPVHISLTDRGGLRERPVGSGISTRFASPELSPDGARAIVSGLSRRSPTIWIVRLDTNATSQLTVNTVLHSAAWINGGREILTVSGPPWCVTGDCFTIERRPADGGPETPLGSGWSPTMSPDGQHLVFSGRAADAGQSEWDLFTRDMKTGIVTPFQGWRDAEAARRDA